MRAELPAAVARAVAEARGATLIFDRARYAATCAAVATAARAHGIVALAAMKAFPDPRAWELAGAALDGFDVASAGEAAAASALRPRVVSIADPSGAIPAVPGATRVIASCELAAQVATVPRGADVAIRLSASAGGADPAIGAILDGSGHRRSRFGVDVAPAPRRAAIAAIAAAVRARGDLGALGAHVHHGGITATSPARFVTTARTAIAALRDAGVEPAFVNLGGAWHGLPELPAAFAALRAAIEPTIELVIEPGRALARDAGFACGAITHARTLDDRALVVCELSRACHLRWSAIDLVAPPPAAGDGLATAVVGPTCFEDDLLGEWIVAPGILAPGARVVVRDVTGYAVAWNSGMGTIAPATITFV